MEAATPNPDRWCIEGTLAVGDLSGFRAIIHIDTHEASVKQAAFKIGRMGYRLASGEVVRWVNLEVRKL
jgi:hypothetical protein